MDAMTVEGLRKSYRSGFLLQRQLSVEDISFSVPQGEIFGYLGPNGAGKSTTIKCLLNLVRPDAGRIQILGREPSAKGLHDQIGYLPENPVYYDYLTPWELLEFGGRVAGMSSGRIRERGEDLLQQVGLAAVANRRLRTYSKGMVQRAGLAYALIHDPEVVILDEPMSGLDPLGRRMVGELIRELKNQGKTVFFSSHILNDIERIADHIAIVAKGRVLSSGRLGDMLPDGCSLEDRFMEEIAKVGLV